MRGLDLKHKGSISPPLHPGKTLFLWFRKPPAALLASWYACPSSLQPVPLAGGVTELLASTLCHPRARGLPRSFLKPGGGGRAAQTLRSQCTRSGFPGLYHHKTAACPCGFGLRAAHPSWLLAVELGRCSVPAGSEVWGCLKAQLGQRDRYHCT